MVIPQTGEDPERGLVRVSSGQTWRATEALSPIASLSCGEKRRDRRWGESPGVSTALLQCPVDLPGRLLHERCPPGCGSPQDPCRRSSPCPLGGAAVFGASASSHRVGEGWIPLFIHSTRIYLASTVGQTLTQALRP